MKAILKKLAVYAAALIHWFPAHAKQEKVKAVQSQKQSNEVYKNALTLLKGGAEYAAYRPLYGRELKMLSRRLKQYQRLGWRASRLQKEEALKKLQKEWKRILRNRMRRIKGERGDYPCSLGFDERSVERFKE